MSLPIRHACLVGPRQDKTRLDEFLKLWLPRILDQTVGSSLSNTKIRRLLNSGAIRVNGSRQSSPGMPLKAQWRVELSLDNTSILEDKPVDDTVWAMGPEAVLFEDSHILVVNKPAGIPSDPGRVASRPSMQSLVGAWVQSTQGLNASLAHRLDRETSGVLVFGKTSEAHRGLHSAFSGHRAEKTYLALAGALPGAQELCPREALVLDTVMARVSPASAPCKWGVVSSDGLPARTRITLLDHQGDFGLFKAEPQTGRTHQIRVHLASLGYPLLGDSLYGGRCCDYCTRVMLHAWTISMEHPVHGGRLLVEAPIPGDFLEAMAGLRLTLPEV